MKKATTEELYFLLITGGHVIVRCFLIPKKKKFSCNFHIAWRSHKITRKKEHYYRKETMH